MSCLSYGYETKQQHGATWLKMFYHDSTGGVFFSSVNEALQCSLPNKYSILSELDQRYALNGQYEFLLEYPELSGFNRWKQNNSPIIETEGQYGSMAQGYTPISVSWTVNGWGGLVKSKAKTTFIEGSTSSTSLAWYGIGYISKQYSPKMAGPGKHVYKVCLWVRINDIPLNPTLPNPTPQMSIPLQTSVPPSISQTRKSIGFFVILSMFWIHI